MECIAIDILGPLPKSDAGNKYLLITMDNFSKWPEGYPLPNMEAATCTVADALLKGSSVALACHLNYTRTRGGTSSPYSSQKPPGRFVYFFYGRSKELTVG